MEYDSTKHKIKTAFEKEDQTEADINTLKKIDIFSSPTNSKKKIITVNLIANYNFHYGTGGTFDPAVEIIVGKNPNA